MFSGAKLNFTQPGKDQWRAHTAETEVRLNRALSHISPHFSVCSLAEVGTKWKGRRWNGEKADDRWVPPIHSYSDAFSHLFGISRVVFLWASLRDIQAGAILHLKGQEGAEFTREVHWTCSKARLYKVKGWVSLLGNMDYPSSILKSVGSLGFPFLSREKVFFQWADPNFCIFIGGCIFLLPRCYFI